MGEWSVVQRPWRCAHCGNFVAAAVASHAMWCERCKVDFLDDIWAMTLQHKGIPWYPNPTRYDKLGRRLTP